jgi:hypothetical protein
MSSKTSRLALTIVTCLALATAPTVAEAGMRTGTWRNGMVAGPHGLAWGGHHHVHGHHFGHYRPVHAYYGHPGYSYGYGYYPGYYHRPYYHRRSGSGAAFAAGLIGGLALGAILANAARATPRCYVASRQFVSASGKPFVRHVRRCR